MVRTALVSVISFAFFSSAALSQAQTFGDWAVDKSTSATTLAALTVNDSGDVFGQFCFLGEGSCVWIIALTTGCKEGTKAPVVVNSDAGAVQLEITCGGQLPPGAYGYGYVFTNFDQVDNLVKAATRVGFAIPLEADQFGVVRFSLRGASAAISAMRAAGERRIKPPIRGTRDEKL